jgi:monofunctional biosynthetic peptidoglycan transglycosylase
MSTASSLRAEEPGTPHAVPGPRSEALSDFTPRTPDLGWYVVNDGVMGGKSEGGFEPVSGGLRFTGTTNTDGGGFSSIRSRPVELDLADWDGIRVRVRGDGRRYTWRLTTDARWRGRQVGYWADFETQRGEWIEAEIPFSRFRAQWRGRMLDDIPLDPRSIRGMGLMIYDKRDGPFALDLARIEVYRSRHAFSLDDLHGSSRVLVLSAPSRRDAALVSQLEAIDSAREDFDERDLVAVVLVDGPGARAGDRRLRADEVRALRASLDLAADRFSLRLVGKDGGVKRSADRAVPMDELFTLIDAMPMRRAEMRRDGR